MTHHVVNCWSAPAHPRICSRRLVVRDALHSLDLQFLFRILLLKSGKRMLGLRSHADEGLLLGASARTFHMPLSSTGRWQLRDSEGVIHLESEEEDLAEDPEDVMSISSADSTATLSYMPAPSTSSEHPPGACSQVQNCRRDILAACALQYDSRCVTTLSSLSLHSEDEHKGLAIRDFRHSDWVQTPVDSEADSFAKLCLDSLWVPYHAMFRLTTLLRMEPAKRMLSTVVSGPSSPKSICFGAFVFGSQAGLHNTTRTHVWVVRLLCSIVRSLCDEALFSNVFLSLNIPSAPHKDSNNHACVNNILIPLSVWEGGELWVSSPRGSTSLEPGGEPGHVHVIEPPCLQFDARRLHAVLPWSGDRYLLGAFHIRDDWRLKHEDAGFLEDQGFRLSSRVKATKDPYM